MVRNEDAHILEWIAFHSIVGFNALIIVDNLSSDQTGNVVRRAARDFDVKLVEYPSMAPDRQARAYETVCRRFASEFDWIAFLDGDEFLVPTLDTSVEQLLLQRGDTAAVAVGWMIYGSHGHVASPPGLVIENFLTRAQIDFEPNRHVKSIVRPNKVYRAINPHAFSVDGRYVDVDGAAVEWITPGMSARPLASQSWRVNHYLTRSADHWARRLQRRQPGNNARTTEEFTVYDRNEVVDPVAARYGPLVNEALRHFA